MIYDGVTRPTTRNAPPKVPLAVRAELAAALANNATAQATFDAFAPSHCREYVE